MEGLSAFRNFTADAPEPDNAQFLAADCMGAIESALNQLAQSQTQDAFNQGIEGIQQEVFRVMMMGMGAGPGGPPGAMPPPDGFTQP